MTKLQAYDELEIDERPRVCGGAVFLKLMKKSKCGSSPPKNEIPLLTSSSSSTSSHTSSTSLNNVYDPSKTHFCMPRQIGGLGTTIAEECKDSYKLDFKLQAEEHTDFIYNAEADRSNILFGNDEVDFHVEDRSRSHSIIQLNPQVVNDLKTKHMQLLNEKKIPEGNSKTEQSSIQRGMPGKGSAFEQPTSLRNDPERAFFVEQSNTTPRIDFLTEEIDDNNDIDFRPKKQEVYESRAIVLRKEMTSFRRELNAVKRSLPNQFHTNHFSDQSNSRDEGPMREPDADKKSLQNQLDSHQGNAWKTAAFDSNPSEEQTQGHVKCEQKYFKNNWNLNFQHQENIDKTETSDSTPQNVSLKNTDQKKMVQNSESSSSLLGKTASFPECSEMQFDQGLNPKEIEMNENKSPEDTEINKHLSSLELSTQITQEESGKARSQSHSIAHNSIQRENTKENRVSSTPESNYEEDMEIVRMLMGKYGKNINENLRADRARRVNAIVDVPTDAWFHRHAAGMKVLKKSRKSSASKLDPPESYSRKNEHSIPEKPKQPQGTVAQVTSKKINRVHFKNSDINEATEKSTMNHFKSLAGNRIRIEDGRQPIDRNTSTTKNPTQSPGRMSDKIKFWEGKQI